MSDGSIGRTVSPRDVASVTRPGARWPGPRRSAILTAMATTGTSDGTSPTRRPTTRTPALVLARWLPAALWVTLPLTTGPVFAEALDGRSAPVVLVAQIGLWAAWTGGLVASLAPSTVSLTAIRILFPASAVAALWAAATVADHAGTAASFALGTTSAAAVVSLWATVGYVFVNGSSYGDERRFPLRPPGPVVLGPLELVWAAMVATTFAGPMLLAARQWVPGAILTVVAVAVDIAGARALHQLSRRWLVFVPAGMVLVDRTVLLDAMLTLRQRIESVGVALVDTEAFDLGAGAIGIEIELRLTDPDSIIPTPARRDRRQMVTPLDVSAVRFTPSRPGWVLDAARERRLTVR